MQNKKYKATYQCRACGKRYSNVGVDDEKSATDYTEATLGDNNNPIFPMVRKHKCENGSIGITDFCGFVKEGVEKNNVHEPQCVTNVNINIEDILGKVKEKILVQIQETKSVTKDRYKYKKKSIQEIEEFIEQCLISKEDYICFFTEEKKYSDLELHIVKRKDFKNLERYLKQNPHIRVVSGIAFSKDGKMTLEEIYMFLEKDLEENIRRKETE